jgi:hypothetical protein
MLLKMTEKKSVYPILPRPTPILDAIRGREGKGAQFLKEYSWAATWIGFAIAVAALAGSQS